VSDVILGISAYYHDSAAALLRDGELIAAAQEERFSRRKHDPSFPQQAIDFCLRQAGLEIDDVNFVAFYDKPLLKFERILSNYTYMFPLSLAAFYKAMPVWLRQKLWVPTEIRRHTGYEGDILFTEHHEAHAASSLFPSPFSEANILTIDGVGEWATATRGFGSNNRIELWDEVRFPHSLGLLYSAVTYYLGFKVNSAEYKVMGLAPYGQAKYLDEFAELVKIYADGSFHLNMKYFTYDYGLRMVGRRFEKLFGRPRRKNEAEELQQFHKDVAMSLQRTTEEIVLRMAQSMVEKTGNRNLCLAGGVALNCVANGRVLRETEVENVFIQPAAGDAGGAVGAAVFVHHQLLGKQERHPLQDVYLGPEFADDEILTYLESCGAIYRQLDENTLLEYTVNDIESQRVIGWFQGRMEFGPRALGNRSILADARQAENRDRVNLKIKFRESFRPFAPSVTAEALSEFFAIEHPTPYMLLVADVRKEKRLVPAITHVDGSARIQSVEQGHNRLYHALIDQFGKKTGVPVIINTSFNVRGEPIVCTPEDAMRCFMTTNMDTLVLGSFYLRKEENNSDQMQAMFSSQVAAD
jgi:carbamoyltransferase